MFHTNHLLLRLVQGELYLPEVDYNSVCSLFHVLVEAFVRTVLIFVRGSKIGLFLMRLAKMGWYNQMR